jgi:phosphohistidine swiveling domain-containing protein
MIQTTVVLNGSGLGAELVGAKAAAIERLIGLGLPVPKSGSVTTEAYVQFVEEAHLGEELHQLGATPTPDESAIQDVQERFMTAPMSPDLADAIVLLSREVAGTSPFAVRSSATAEDMSSSSFAGQYRSFLNVDSPAELLASVRKVWASLWLPGPIAYRNFQGVDSSQIAMGVLVMKMVPARLAGVVFTADPGGTPDVLRIESVKGLGELLVSGAVTPDAYLVDRTSYHEVLPAPLPDVIDLSLQIEQALGSAQDIEWAYDGQQVFIVQARPVTTQSQDHTDLFDTPPDPTVTYTTAGIAEMMPEVLSPWLWSIAGRLLEEAFRIVYDDLGALPDLSTPFGILGRFRGRAATNLDVLKEAVALRPGGSPDELEQQYFKQTPPGHGGEAGSDGQSRSSLGWHAVTHSVRELKARSRFVREADAVIPAVEGILDASVDVSQLSDKELTAYTHRLIDLGGRIMAAQVGVAASAAAAYRALELFFDKQMEAEQAASWVRRLTSGAGESGSGQLIFRLRELVREHLDGPLGEILVEGVAAEQLWKELAGHPRGISFIERWNTIVKRAGSASVFGGQTWEEQGSTTDLLTQATELALAPDRHLAEKRHEALVEVERELRSDPKWKRTRWLTGQVVDVRIWILRRMVDGVLSLLTRREHSKMALLRLGGEVRRSTLEIGRRLTQSTVLSNASEVELLTLFELSGLFDGRRPSPKTLETRGRHLARARDDRPLPLRFVGRPTASEADVLAGNVFKGWAGSAGEYTGRAVVVTDPTSKLPRGSVLVARTTDASWTPLFLRAGAVVVEHGGPLSHAAIVAREIGLPAVLNLPGLIDRLAGETVDLTVDGYSGSVTIHPTVESAPQ